MEAIIAIVSLKDSSLTPQIRKIDLSSGRPTELIGNAVRSLVEKCSAAYKQPCLQVHVGKEMVGAFSPKGGTFAEKIRSVNFGITELILNSCFTTEELMNNSNTANPIALGIAKAFGHNGTKVSVDVAVQNLKAVEKAAKTVTKYAKQDSNKLYEKIVGADILALENQAKVERKALAEAKKQTLLIAGN